MESHCGGKKCLPVFIYLWISRDLVVWSLPDRGFSLICLFSLISDIDPSCSHFVKLEQREKYKSTGSAVRSQTLCSDIISITLTDRIEDSPNDDLTFSLEVGSPNMFAGITFFLSVTKIKTLPTKVWHLYLISFMVLLWFFLIGKWYRKFHFLGILFYFTILLKMSWA